jgi:hypothetical protein
MSQDLANSIVLAAKIMEQKQKTKNIVVLSRGRSGEICINTGSNFKERDEVLGYNIAYAYNHLVNKDYVPLDKEDPATHIISQAFNSDPDGEKFIGVFMKLT